MPRTCAPRSGKTRARKNLFAACCLDFPRAPAVRPSRTRATAAARLAPVTPPAVAAGSESLAQRAIVDATKEVATALRSTIAVPVMLAFAVRTMSENGTHGASGGASRKNRGGFTEEDLNLCSCGGRRNAALGHVAQVFKL